MTQTHLNNAPRLTLPTDRTERAAMVALILSGRERARMELDSEIARLKELLREMYGNVSELAGRDGK